MRRLPYFAALGLMLLVTAPCLHAQTLTSADEALWQVNLHFQRLFASPLGNLINEVIKKEAPEGETNINAFIEAMGMDPRTAIQEVVLFGNGFEPTSLHAAVANIGSTRGNIEGWLLAAPGYQSEAINDNTILHSFALEDHGPDARLWCAIPFNKASNSNIVVAATNRDTAMALIAEVTEQGISKFRDQLSGNTLLSVRINDLSRAPIEIDEDDPGSGIIKSLESASVIATNENNQQLIVTTELTADSPARAQQLQQLLMGMKAMMQFALPEKKPEAKQFAQMLNNVNIEYAQGSKTLSTKFAMGYAEIEKLVKEKHNIK
jgi:hypothetical protein